MTASLESWSRPADPRYALGALAAVAAFLVAWVLLHQGFYARGQVKDTPVYQHYGDLIADGEVPYRDFRPEYPPLALPVFVLPSLLQTEPGLDGYETVFEWLLVLCGTAAVALTALSLRTLGAGPARFGAALAFVALAPLALGSVVVSRFDLWPAALAAGALAALLAGRDLLGGGVLGLAVAAKLYPAVLAPVAAIWIWRRSGRRRALAAAGVFLAAIGACFLPFLLLAPDGVTASLGRQLSRPLQIESLGSAAALAFHHLFGLGLEMVGSHGSQNIAGDTGAALGVAATVVQVAVLAAILIAFARGPMSRERLVRYAAASVVAFVALGKVLSPQFLIWLVPLVPLVAGRRGAAASALLGVALVLTQVWFPYRYWDFARTFDETVSWLVLARDLVLVVALLVLVLPTRRGPERARS